MKRETCPSGINTLFYSVETIAIDFEKGLSAGLQVETEARGGVETDFNQQSCLELQSSFILISRFGSDRGPSEPLLLTINR
jgi:hypothetical protein